MGCKETAAGEDYDNNIDMATALPSNNTLTLVTNGNDVQQTFSSEQSPCHPDAKDKKRSKSVSAGCHNRGQRDNKINQVNNNYIKIYIHTFNYTNMLSFLSYVH